MNVLSRVCPFVRLSVSPIIAELFDLTIFGMSVDLDLGKVGIVGQGRRPMAKNMF